ncbi:MAG: tetratricopeptide repeat protein [Microcoleus sp.]
MKDLLFQLNEAEKAENFQRVIDLGTRILEINVQHQPTRSQTATAYRLRGISSYDRSDYDKAVEDFNRAIDLNPEKADSYYQRARAYHKKSDWDRVIVDCERAIKRKKEADYYYQRGRAYHNKGDYDQAITDFKLAIQIDRKKADYYYLQGFSLYAKGNSLRLPQKTNYDQEAIRVYDRAIESLNEAIRLKPDRVAKYYEIRGLCHLHRTRYDQAINDFNHAKSLDPNPITYNYNYLLGLSYAGKRDYTSAIIYLGLAIGFLNESKNVDYYYQRSLCYYNRGQNDRRNNQDFLNLLKNVTDWQHILSNSQKSDDQNALEDINRAIELDQFNSEYLQLKNRIEDRLLRGH